jgi:Zn ribbon nucleic-acid-binding protein
MAHSICNSLLREGDTVDQRIRALYFWVTDSIEFVDSDYCWDFDDQIDKKLRDRKATGAEKVLILQKLCEQAGIVTTPLVLVPTTLSPGVTKIPAITQFRNVLLEWTHDGQTIYLDPTYRHTAFGIVNWEADGALALRISKDVEECSTISLSTQTNLLLYDIVSQLDESGTMSGHIQLTLDNQQTLKHRRQLWESDTTKLKDYVARNFVSQLKPEEISRVIASRPTHLTRVVF